MFGRANIDYDQPSFNSQREDQRPFQVREEDFNRESRHSRYAISPIRDTRRRSGSPMLLHANGSRARESNWRVSPQQDNRRSGSFERRRSRSRSFNRDRNYSPRNRRSPVRRRHSRSRSPQRSTTWHQTQHMSPQRNRSPPRPVGMPQHDLYSYRRSRSRSGSNMDVASDHSLPDDHMFQNTFRPVEQKKTKKIKISVPKDLPREESSSPEVVEVDYRGHKIRNAPPASLGSSHKERRSRWDTDQSSLIPSTKEILEQQGVRNPDEALAKIASLPTMDQKFKSQTDDDAAIQIQLALLDQQSRFNKIRENLPPTIGMPAPSVFSAIGKTKPKNTNPIVTSTVVSALPISNTLTTSNPANLPPQMNPIGNFPPPGFPPFVPGSMPPMGIQPSFSGPSPADMAMPPFGMPQMGMPTGFNAPPPVSAAMGMPQMSTMPQGPDVIKFNLTNIGGPPPTHMEPQLDPTEMFFKARADLYRRDLSQIYSIPDLVKYRILGVSALYQIICFGHPELETYYCGMCNHWTTVSEMFGHLNATMHRMNFLARNYKLFHKKAEEHQDLAERDKFLEFICKRVWKIDGSGSCANRMRCILNIDVIKQVWPNYIEFVDNSWKMLGTKDGIDAMLDSGRTQPSQLDEQPVILSDNPVETLYPGGSNKGKIMIKPSVNTVLSRPIGELEKIDERARSRERRRSRSKSRDRARKRSHSRSRRRSRSSSRNKRDSRRRSRSKSPRYSKTSSSKGNDKRDDWERRAAQFIDKINSDGIKSVFGSESSSKRDDYESSRTSRRKENADSDENQLRLTRKAVAVLIELQQEHNKTNSIKKSMIYSIANEMGMSEEEVRDNKILKQGLETMNIVDDANHKSLSLESLGMSSSDLKKLLSSVTSTSSKTDDPSMLYPEVGSESQLISSIRAVIRETQQKMNDPNHAHMRAELKMRLNHLETKLSQELGVDPTQRGPPPMANRPPNAQPLLPGAWRGRALAGREAAPSAAEQQRAAAASAMRARREPEEKRVSDEHRFDASKVEQEWTEYYVKDPSKIEEVNKTDKHAEAQYDGYYGPGTYIAFCAAKQRAAVNAKRALRNGQPKSHYEDFSR